VKTVFVIFQLDTEDFITPETDDILLDLTRIFNKYGIRGSFAIVGEKARKLLERKRFDIIDALKTQDIAYQSNFHSVHPTISEYILDKDWNEGINEFIKREKQGLEDLENIFGIKASAFIQPGGSWAPQAVCAVNKLSIRVYADGIFEEQPIWYCNEIAIRGSVSYNAVLSGTEEHFTQIKSKFEKKYNELKSKGGVIVVILHPCMFKTKEFWDSINYARGKNPTKLLPAPIVSDEEYKMKLLEFERFVKFILGHKDVKVITYRDLPEIIEKTPEKISIDKIYVFAEKMIEKLSYHIVDGLILSASEIFGVIVDFLSEYYINKCFPSNVKIRKLLGPLISPSQTNETYVSTKSVFNAVLNVKEFLDKNNYIPNSIVIDDKPIDAGSFLRTISKMLLDIRDGKSLPSKTKIAPASKIPHIDGIDIADRIKRNWKWIILPENFYSEKIIEYSLLQLWTWKPAKLKDV